MMEADAFPRRSPLIPARASLRCPRMKSDLIFGWRTAVLLPAIGQMLILAIALTRASVNRCANHCFAALLIVLVGLLTPDMIGFAGFYDAFPWLSFAPFAVPLAVGPLLYFYVCALTGGVLPRRVFLHLSPPLVQFVYLAASFCLPLAIKNGGTRSRRRSCRRLSRRA